MENRMHNGVGSAFTRRNFLTMGGLVAGTLLLASCGGTSLENANTPKATFDASYDGPKITLNYWNGLTGGDGETMLTMVEAFNKAHENIQITTTSMVWADLYSKIVTAVEAGEGPDVALMQLDQLATFAVRGTIVPLDDVAKTLGLTKADFSPSVWAGSIFQDKRYGIPLDMFTIAQFWDKSAFSKVGITGPITSSDDFDSAMVELQKSGIKNPFWVPSISPSWQMWLGLMGQFGGELYNAKSGKYTFDSDAGVEALNWLVKQVQSGVSPQGVTDLRPAMMNGSAAVLTDGLWSIADFATNAPGLDVGIGAFPGIGRKPAAFANSHNFTITKQANSDDNRGQASRVFIDWVSQNSGDWAKSGNIPARASVRDTAAFATLPQAVLDTPASLDSFTFLPQLPGGRDIAGNTFQAAVAEAILLQKKPADALKSAAVNAQKQLDENRALFGF